MLFATGMSGSIKVSAVLSTGLRSCIPAVATTVVFSFFVNLLAFTSPLYMLQIYDRVIGSRNETTLLGITLLVAYLLVINALLEMLRSRIMVQASLIVDSKLAGAVFDATHSAGLHFPRLAQGQSLRDLDAIREFVAGPGLIALCDLMWMPIFVTACFILHPWFGAIAIGGTVVIFVLTLASELATTRPLGLASKASGVATQKAVSALRNGEVIQAMGMLGVLRDAWLVQHSQVLNLQAVAGGRSGLITAASKFVRMFLQTMILGLGAYLAIHNQISAGMIIAASIFVGRALAPVEGVVGNWKGLTNARNAWTRLVKLFAVAGEEAQQVALPRPSGHLRLEAVTAGPPEQSRVTLRNISFEAHPGEIVGVVGPSAAGKSSLARVITGVWPPSSGSVRLDGSDFAHWGARERGRHIGYLPQDIELFSGTVAQNIARFQEVGSDVVIETAQLVRLSRDDPALAGRLQHRHRGGWCGAFGWPAPAHRARARVFRSALACRARRAQCQPRPERRRGAGRGDPPVPVVRQHHHSHHPQDQRAGGGRQDPGAGRRRAADLRQPQ